MDLPHLDGLAAAPRPPGPRTSRRRAAPAVPTIPLADPARRSRPSPPTARGILEEHGIDEPLQWTPQLPARALRRLALPGPDPGSITVAQLHQAVPSSDFSIAQVARSLNTTTAHIVCLLSKYPADWSPPRFRPTEHTATRLEQWRTWYKQDHLSLQDIVDREGTSLATVRLTFIKNGVPLRLSCGVQADARLDLPEDPHPRGGRPLDLADPRGLHPTAAGPATRSRPASPMGEARCLRQADPGTCPPRLSAHPPHDPLPGRGTEIHPPRTWTTARPEEHPAHPTPRRPHTPQNEGYHVPEQEVDHSPPPPHRLKIKLGLVACCARNSAAQRRYS